MMMACELSPSGSEDNDALADNASETCPTETIEQPWQYHGEFVAPTPDQASEIEVVLEEGKMNVLDFVIPFDDERVGAPTSSPRKNRHDYIVLISGKTELGLNNGGTIPFPIHREPLRQIFQSNEACPAIELDTNGEILEMRGGELPQLENRPSGFGLGASELPEDVERYRLVFDYEIEDEATSATICVIDFPSDPSGFPDSDLLLEKIQQTSCYDEQSIGNPMWPWKR